MAINIPAFEALEKANIHKKSSITPYPANVDDMASSYQC
jgi:hypothetical protein